MPKTKSLPFVLAVRARVGRGSDTMVFCLVGGELGAGVAITVGRAVGAVVGNGVGGSNASSFCRLARACVDNKKK